MQCWDDLGIFPSHPEMPPLHHIPDNTLPTLHYMCGLSWYRVLDDPSPLLFHYPRTLFAKRPLSDPPPPAPLPRRVRVLSSICPLPTRLQHLYSCRALEPRHVQTTWRDDLGIIPSHPEMPLPPLRHFPDITLPTLHQMCELSWYRGLAGPPPFITPEPPLQNAPLPDSPASLPRRVRVLIPMVPFARYQSRCSTYIGVEWLHPFTSKPPGDPRLRWTPIAVDGASRHEASYVHCTLWGTSRSNQFASWWLLGGSEEWGALYAAAQKLHYDQQLWDAS